jgi:hypothetical protein
VEIKKNIMERSVNKEKYHGTERNQDGEIDDLFSEIEGVIGDFERILKNHATGYI